MTRDRQLFPHHAEHRRLELPTGPLAVLDTGAPSRPDGAATPAVVLVPGYTGAKEDFAPLLDPLRDTGFRAIAIDLPGQHESPGPEQEDDYAPDPLSRAVAALIATLDAPVVLLGHSYGGLVARAAVIAGAPVAGLVLLSSGPAALPPGPRAQAVVAGEPVMREHGQAVTFDLQQQVLAATGRIERDTALQEYFRTRFVASAAAGLLGIGRAILAEPDRVDELAAALARRSTPVAVVAGEADDAWPLPLQADMARRLGTSLVVVPGAAHSAAVEAPEALLRVLLPLLRSWT